MNAQSFGATSRQEDALSEKHAYAVLRLDESFIRAVLEQAHRDKTPLDEVARDHFTVLCRDFTANPFRTTSEGVALYTGQTLGLAAAYGRRAQLHELANMLDEMVPVAHALASVREGGKHGHLPQLVQGMEHAVSEFTTRIVNRRWFEPEVAPFEASFANVLEQGVLNYYASAADQMRRYARSNQLAYLEQRFSLAGETLKKNPKIWAAAEPLWEEFERSYQTSRAKLLGHS